MGQTIVRHSLWCFVCFFFLSRGGGFHSIQIVNRIIESYVILGPDAGQSLDKPFC